MATRTAEGEFKKGLALMDAEPVRAAEHFEAAVTLELRGGPKNRGGRAMSYLALCRAQHEGQIEQWISVCERALRRASLEPDVYLNLGRLYLMNRQRGRAIDMLLRGLRLCPDHPGLIAEFSATERRSPPPVPFLDRSNPVNEWLGRRRAQSNRGERRPDPSSAG